MIAFFDDADQQDDADQRDEREPVLNHISASSAPTPAEGSVERMVMGCTRFSYRMPSTR